MKLRNVSLLGLAAFSALGTGCYGTGTFSAGHSAFGFGSNSVSVSTADGTSVEYGTARFTRKLTPKSVDLNPGAEIRIQNIFGDIRVTTWDQSKVEATVVVSTSGEQAELDEAKIDYDYSNGESTRDHVFVKTILPKRSHLRVDYEVKIPARADLGNIETSIGDVAISGVEGKVTASSSNGDVILKGTIGEFELRSSTGSVAVQESQGFGHASSSNGNVRVALSRLSGPVHAESSLGNVELKLPSEANASVQASTTLGMIDSSFSEIRVMRPEFGTGSTASGALGDPSRAASVELRSSNGNVSIGR